MSNTTLTADVVAKASLAILENELAILKTLYRAHESEFNKNVNGYKVGDTIRIRRPADFTVRTGANVSTQDVIEGYTSLVVDQQKGVDFKFTSSDLTLKIEDLSERVLKPAMSSLVNNIAEDVFSQMYKGAYHWVGTPGNKIDSFSDFSVPMERMDLAAIPQEDRYAALHPADYWGMVGSLSGLYISDAARDALRKGNLGMIGNADTYMSQVLPTHTNGTWDATTPLVKGASQNVTYDTAKNTWSQTLNTDGWDASATIKAGSVFTIDDVYMVNPKTKAKTSVLQQFVVTADVTADGTTTNTTSLTISPPIITSGPHQTVDAAPADDAVITPLGSASTGYRQNLFYHKNAMALAMVPMELPPGAYGAARDSYKGISVRVIPYYSGGTDESNWRLDVLYGRKLVDPRLVVRSSGSGT